jgi:hypothetical protein
MDEGAALHHHFTVIASSGPAAGRPAWMKESRHCEERSDEAIQGCSTVLAALDRHAAKRRLAMTGRCRSA